MLRSFNLWFDAVSDRWNPIMVRELRRLMRSYALPIATILHLVSLLMLHRIPIRDSFAQEFFEIIARSYPTVIAMSLSGFYVIIGMLHNRWGDELFETIPLTPRERVNGYLGTSAVLSAFFLVQALPFFMFPSASLYAVPIRLGILIGCLFLTQIGMLFYLSFFVRTTSILEAVLTFFGLNYLGVLAIELPFIGATLLWSVSLGLPSLEPSTMSSWPFIVFAAVYVILAAASLGWVAYLLSEYHFKNRSENCWTASFKNLFAYAVWSFALAVIGFAGMFVFMLESVKL